MFYVENDIAISTLFDILSLKNVAMREPDMSHAKILFFKFSSTSFLDIFFDIGKMAIRQRPFPLPF